MNHGLPNSAEATWSTERPAARPKRHSRKKPPHCPGQVEALEGFDGMVLTVAVTGSGSLREEPQPECCI